MYFLLPTVARRRATRWGLLAAPFVLAYVAAGWGREGAIFAAVKAISTAGSHQDSSSLACQEEIRNLLYALSTIGNPLLGTGWGVGYKEVRPVDSCAAMTVLCLLPAYGIQCFGDIGFQSLTCALLLGVAIGSAAKLSVWGELRALRGRQLLQAAA